MTDVLKIALDRRAELQAEVEKLDEFIRMAESLIRATQRTPEDSDKTEEPEESGGSRPNLLRRGPTVING